MKKFMLIIVLLDMAELAHAATLPARNLSGQTLRVSVCTPGVGCSPAENFAKDATTIKIGDNATSVKINNIEKPLPDGKKGKDLKNYFASNTSKILGVGETGLYIIDK
jgi:hypothetical protein